MAFLLSLLSAVCSTVLIAYGLSAMTGETMPVLVIAFGAGAVAYGISNLVLLMLAWFRPAANVSRVAKYLGFGFLVAFTLGSLDVGRISGLEWVAIIFMAFIIWINLTSINAVLAKKRGA